MKLNYDCIRDILLYVEDNTTFENYTISVVNLTEYLKDKYEVDTIYYHIQKIDQTDLVDKVIWADNAPMRIFSLSWEGHQYLDSIRDDSVWKSVTEKIKPLKSVPLQMIVPIATELIKQKLGM